MGRVSGHGFQGRNQPFIFTEANFCDNIWPALPAIGGGYGRGVSPPAKGGSFSKFIKCMHENLAILGIYKHINQKQVLYSLRIYIAAGSA